jgi:transcriptional regulator with XRE-family HTH domain
MKGTQAQRKLGDAMRKTREGLKISQEAFADQIRVHRTYYSAIERGERNLTLKSILKIAEGLGRKASDLLADAGL